MDIGWFGFGAALVSVVVSASLICYAKSLERTITKLAKCISQDCKVLTELRKYVDTNNAESK